MEWCNDDEPRHVDLVVNIVLFHFVLFLMLCVFFATIYFFYKNDSIAKKSMYSFLLNEVFAILWIGWESLASWTVPVFGWAFSSFFCTLRTFILAVIPGLYFNSLFLFLFLGLKQTFEGSSLRITEKQSRLFYLAIMAFQIFTFSWWGAQSDEGCSRKVSNGSFEKYIPQGMYK